MANHRSNKKKRSRARKRDEDDHRDREERRRNDEEENSSSKKKRQQQPSSMQAEDMVCSKAISTEDENRKNSGISAGDYGERNESRKTSEEEDLLCEGKPDKDTGDHNEDNDDDDDDDGDDDDDNQNVEGSSSKDAISTSEDHSDSMSFHNVKPSLSVGILRALKKQPFEFTKMTPVQAAVIPLFLRHKDVCVQAETGSGKTLAFLIPMIEMCLRKEVPLKRHEIGGLVISPTRELAMQTHTIATILCEEVQLPKPLLLVGGSNRSVVKDLEWFHEYGSDIIVATPGRLDDITSRYDNISFSSQSFECLILDEADVLLDMGFQQVLSSILSKVPKMRRTGLFSATQTKAVKMLGRAGLRNPVMINVSVDSNNNSNKGQARANEDNKMAASQIDEGAGDSSSEQQQATPSSLTNYYMICPLEDKLTFLTRFILEHPNEKMVIFCLTCAIVEFLGVALPQIKPLKGIHIESLHGKMVQKRREKVLERFRCGGNKNNDGESNTRDSGGVLICTDVAARGLDVSDVDWVVQMDAPPDPNVFVHRVGRCARAGRFGRSLIMLSPAEEPYVDFLKLRKIPIQNLNFSSSTDPNLNGGEEKATTGETSSSANVGGNDDNSNATTNNNDNRNNTTADDVLPLVKHIVLHDRDALEKGTKAFTSYVRAYKEHQCSFIFRFNNLDLGSLATSFCLLRLPKMPELRDLHASKLKHFTPVGPEVNIHAIAFKDKNREQARQRRLQEELKAGGKNAKQIRAEQRAAERIEKAKERRQEALQKGRNPHKKRLGKQKQLYDEWDDLAEEERLHKRLKKGKISQKEYDKHFMNLSSSDLKRSNKAKKKTSDDDEEVSSDEE